MKGTVTAVAAALGWLLVESAVQADTAVPFCKGDTDRRSARAAIAALEAIAGSRDARLPELQQQWQRLWIEPCLSYANLLMPVFDSLVSFRDWWRSGGERWLIELVEPDRELWVAPGARPTLTAEQVSDVLQVSSRGEPFTRRLFCRRADTPCDPDAVAWMRDMELAVEPRPRSTHRVGPLDDPDGCPDMVARLPAPQRYRGFVECVTADRRARVARFPAGSFRAPATGWLVLRTSLGQTAGAQGFGAYDLETGAAYLVSAEKARLGRVSRWLARQTLFLIAFTGFVPPGSPRLRHYKVPDGVQLVWWLDDDFQVGWPGGSTEGIIAGSSAYDWAWLEKGAVVAKGSFTLPVRTSGFDAYLEQRLEMLSDTVTEGCPPRKPPFDAFGKPPKPAWADDGSPAALALWQKLESSWRSALSRPACPK